MFDFMKSKSGKTNPKVQPAIPYKGKRRAAPGKSTMQVVSEIHKGRKTIPAKRRGFWS